MRIGQFKEKRKNFDGVFWGKVLKCGMGKKIGGKGQVARGKGGINCGIPGLAIPDIGANSIYNNGYGFRHAA
jgi:hypothetical protein